MYLVHILSNQYFSVVVDQRHILALVSLLESNKQVLGYKVSSGNEGISQTQFGFGGLSKWRTKLNQKD
jgi:hypothetical protein